MAAAQLQFFLLEKFLGLPHSVSTLLSWFGLDACFIACASSCCCSCWDCFSGSVLYQLLLGCCRFLLIVWFLILYLPGVFFSLHIFANWCELCWMASLLFPKLDLMCIGGFYTHDFLMKEAD